MSVHFSNLISLPRRGFTLIELLVTISIMTAIISIVFSNQSKYTDSTDLQNMATNIALSVREAQVYGVSVKDVSPGLGEFTSGYGVEFNTTPSGDNSAYLSFADRNNNGSYDSSWSCPSISLNPSSECLRKVSLSSGNTISALCYIDKSNIEQCASSGIIDITFIRPETDAHIQIINLGNNATPSQTNINGICIKLSSPNGARRNIVLYNTGQVSVTNSATCLNQ